MKDLFNLGFVWNQTDISSSNRTHISLTPLSLVLNQQGWLGKPISTLNCVYLIANLRLVINIKAYKWIPNVVFGVEVKLKKCFIGITWFIEPQRKNRSGFAGSAAGWVTTLVDRPGISISMQLSMGSFSFWVHPVSLSEQSQKGKEGTHWTYTDV